MVHIQSNNSNSKFDDGDKKREAELKHIQDIREHLECRLAQTNKLFMDLSYTLFQLKKEKDSLR